MPAFAGRCVAARAGCVHHLHAHRQHAQLVLTEASGKIPVAGLKERPHRGHLVGEIHSAEDIAVDHHRH